MDIQTIVTENLKWDLPESGNFTAKLENNKIVDLEFCENWKDTSSALTSANEIYLRNIHKALTLLFDHIDGKNNKPTEYKSEG